MSPPQPSRIRIDPIWAVRRNPKRTTARAATAAERAHIRTTGVTTAPAAMAVPPRAPCTNSGTKVSTPKIVVPMSTPER
jgi:hypothetical protein